MAKRGKAAGAAEAKPNVSVDDIAEYYVEYTEMMGQIARIRQRISSTDARYKGMGVPTKAVKACYRLANMEDAPDYMKDVLRSAAILKIIPAAEESDGQMTFLPGLKVAPPSAESAAKVNRSQVFWAGHDAGVSGDLMDACKFEPGTEDYVTWERGWKDGNEDWKAKPKNQNVETASAEARPRGRPRKGDRVDDRTQLEKDEASFRPPGPDMEESEPITGTIQ